MRATIDKAGRFPVIQSPCPFQHNLIIDWSAPPAGILHTTEGGWPGSIGVFKQHFAPHFLVGLNGSGQAEIAQLMPVGFTGLACRAHNNKARVETEVIGLSKETLWHPDPETLDALASLMLVCRDEWGIPLVHPWPDGDYGRAGPNPHRTSGKYGTVSAWFGHGDMPGPDQHWDPGALAWSVVFARAKELAGESASTVAQAPVPSSAIPPVASWPVLAFGSAGANVEKLQRALGITADGRFGPKTKAAVDAFQRKHPSLTVDGVVGAETWAALAKAAV